jgi:aspartyl aminopeptidase
VIDHADDYIDFLNEAVTPFHAVAELKRRFGAEGFSLMNASSDWKVHGGDRLMIESADGRSLIAIVVGEECPAHGGYSIIGSHTDSPDLRLKPVPVSEKGGVTRLHTQFHGGLIYRSWLDRPLDLGGCLYHIVRDDDGRPKYSLDSELPEIKATVVRAGQPVGLIPDIAIHLDREKNDKGEINPEKWLNAVLGTGSPDEVMPKLSELLGHDLEKADGFHLHLFPHQPALRVGIDRSIILGPRHDDLAMVYASAQALVESLKKRSERRRTRVAVFFDAEEVGSMTSSGAHSGFLRDNLLRLTRSHQAFVREEMDPEQAFVESFVISADMVHAVHPNHPEKHEERHAPKINEGLVIKTNANERYATTGETGAMFRAICERANVPVQGFVIRQDMRCGSTIGPMTSALLGARTVDVGIPMWGMHSTGESVGAQDLGRAVAAFAEHFCGRPEGSL